VLAMQIARTGRPEKLRLLPRQLLRLLLLSLTGVVLGAEVQAMQIACAGRSGRSLRGVAL